MIIFETKRLNMVEATKDDITEIIELENDPENRNFVWQGTSEQHLFEIDDPNHMLLMFVDKESGEHKGYTLCHIDNKSHVFELRRIAISDKGRGYGREAINGIIKYAFEHLNMNKLWLDVYPDNIKGINLYESLGMHRDGVLRQNYLSERGYLDQIVYSLLRSEYEAMKK